MGRFWQVSQGTAQACTRRSCADPALGRFDKRVAAMPTEATDNSNFASYLDLLRPAARPLGVTLIRVDARNAADLPQAFAMMQSSAADAIRIAHDRTLAGVPAVRQQIIQWAPGRRLPLASSSARVAPDGGLLSLGTDNSALVKRAAFYVHRILGGAGHHGPAGVAAASG